MRNANSLAIAGGAIAAASINALLKKGLLTKEEAVDALKNAQIQLGPFIQTGGDDAVEAARIIGETILAINKDRI